MSAPWHRRSKSPTYVLTCSRCRLRLQVARLAAAAVDTPVGRRPCIMGIAAELGRVLQEACAVRAEHSNKGVKAILEVGSNARACMVEIVSTARAPVLFAKQGFRRPNRARQQGGQSHPGCA